MRLTRPGALTRRMAAASTSPKAAARRRRSVAESILSAGDIGNARAGAPQALGGLLRQRVVDEGARAGLRAGEVLQLRLGSVRRVELEVEMVVVVAAVGGPLVDGHDVREREAEERVVLAQQGLECQCQPG